MKAHQRIVREERAVTDTDNLFGNWWDVLNKDLSKTIVKPITHQEAKEIIEKYEWLGCMSAINLFYFGIFFDGACGGCVVYGLEYSENLGVWDKYDYTGKMILLSRGVCVHWTPKNTGSKLIMESIRLLPEKYKIVTCTVDALAGEIGTIYQACNFHYIGNMRENNPNVKNALPRDAWKIKGKLYGSRAIRAKIGSQRKEEILKYFPDAEYCEQKSKERYFYFTGSRKEKAYHLSKIQDFIKDYPKR